MNWHACLAAHHLNHRLYQVNGGKIMVEFFSTGDEPAFSMDAVYSEGRQGGTQGRERRRPSQKSWSLAGEVL